MERSPSWYLLMHQSRPSSSGVARTHEPQPRSANADPQPRPLVTIVVVTHNSAKGLSNVLREVLDLRRDDVELVIIDGASTDATLEIIRAREGEIDQWLSEPDGGPYEAMNKGLRLGRGQWFYFLGADDRLQAGFLAMLATLQNPATIYYGDVWMPRRSIRYGGAFTPLELALRNICHQAIFYPRCVWQAHRYDPRYPRLADYALNLRCCADANLRFEYVPELVAIFNDQGGLSQSGLDLAFEADRLALVRPMLPLHLYLLACAWHLGLRGLRRIGGFDLAWRAKLALTRYLQRTRRRPGVIPSPTSATRRPTSAHSDPPNLSPAVDSSNATGPTGPAAQLDDDRARPNG
ncbi:MAG TPA: hypothetical protein DIW77_01000 [Chromatiaceae bacterium]|jgi:glycosyltransferase involved in cell wall biosynthesis|nr:hypothetical protein [Chromatiaceae bacterium]